MKHTAYNKVAVIIIAATTYAAVSCKSDDKTQSQEPPVIDVACATTDSVTIYKTYPATLSSDNQVDLVARVNGYITARNFTTGDYVPAGAVVYSIESTQYRDAVNQARAALSNATATAEYNSRNYQALSKALQSDAVSQMEVIQAKSAMEVSQASIASARAQLQSAMTTLSYCTVTAPFGGHIVNGPYQKGSFVAGTGSPVVLATLYGDAVMDIDFYIDAAELNSLVNNPSKTEQLDLKHIPVLFGDSLPGSFTADIAYIAPVLDSSTGTIHVQGTMDNKDGKLRSGMYAKIKLPLNVLPNAVVVEDASIGSDQQGKYMYVVNDSNKVVYTPVKTGELVDDTHRVITSGISPGTRYVSKAMLKVRDGMTIKPRLTR